MWIKQFISNVYLFILAVFLSIAVAVMKEMDVFAGNQSVQILELCALGIVNNLLYFLSLRKGLAVKIVYYIAMIALIVFSILAGLDLLDVINLPENFIS